MTALDIKSKTRKYLKNRYLHAMFILMPIILIYSILSLAQAVVFLSLTRFSESLLDKVIWNPFTLKQLLRFFFGILKFIAAVPAMNAAVWWFSAIAAGGKMPPPDNAIKIFMSFKLTLNSIPIYLLSWLLKLISLLPSALLACGGIILIMSSPDNSNLLFLGIQLLILALPALALYADMSLNLIAMPFLFMKMPNANPFRILLASVKAVNGKKKLILRTLIGFLPALPLMLLIIPIPVVISRIFMSAAIFSEYIQADLKLCIKNPKSAISPIRKNAARGI